MLFGHLLLKLLKVIRTNVSRNTTMVTNMRFNKGLKIRQISYGFHTFMTFLRLGTKTVLDPEALEKEGPEETVYPKLVLLELHF